MGILFLGPVSQWSSWLTAINLDIPNLLNSVTGDTSCVAPLSPYGNMLTTLAGPMAMLFCLLFTAFYSKFYYNERWQSWNYVRTFANVLIFIYVPVTDVVLRYLNCINVNGQLVVASVPAIVCYDSKYNQWLFLVVPVLVLFVAGGPLILLLFLRYQNKAGKLWEEDFVASWGILYEHFSPKRQTYWWVVVTLVRRTVLVAINAFIAARGENYFWLSVCQLGSLLAQLYYNPYRDRNANHMAMWTLILLLLLTIAMGSYSYPYSVGVQAFISLLVLLPSIIFCCIFAWDTFRKMVRPTKRERKIKERKNK